MRRSIRDAGKKIQDISNILVHDQTQTTCDTNPGYPSEKDSLKIASIPKSCERHWKHLRECDDKRVTK